MLFWYSQIYLRLAEKGKQYSESLEQTKLRISKYDDNGRRLFTPAINRDSKEILNSSVSSTGNYPRERSSGGGGGLNISNVTEDGDVEELNSPVAAAADNGSVVGGVRNPSASVGASNHSAAAVDEFLYQDARDREERCRLREREVQAEIAIAAAATKMNSTSHTLLKRKAVSLIIR